METTQHKAHGSTLIAFKLESGNFDLIIVSEELTGILDQADYFDNFLNSYEEAQMYGMLEVLYDLKLPYEFIRDNMTIFLDVPTQVGENLLQRVSDIEQQQEDLSNIVYN